MWLTRGIVIVGIATALGGCGATESDQVRAKVEQFVSATSGRDYKTLCGQVFAPSLLAHLAGGGLSCEEAMQIALGGVSNPTLSIARITVHGGTASAITLTGARGQRAALSAIELVKTSQGWRVSSLGSPTAK
jgi:hypothetical protein